MRKFIVFTAVFILSLFLFSSPLFAFTSRAGNSVIITESIKDDVYCFGGTVDLEEDIYGDFISTGGRLTINGDISGDLIAAGGYLNVNGNIGDDVRIAGGSITVNGSVGGDLIVVGGQISVGKDAVISGDLIVSGGTINIDGEILGDVAGSGGTINIAGTIGGSVYLDNVENLNITSGAEIKGNLEYSSSNKANISSGATIGGEVKRTIPKVVEEVKVPRKAPLAMFTATYYGGKVISFLSLFVLGIILLLAIPKVFDNFNSRMQSTPGRCVGAGAIMFFGTPIGMLILLLISVLLFVTVLGAGLGVVAISSDFMLLTLYIILIYVSSVFLSFFIGRLILSYTTLDLSKYGWKVLAYLVGLAIVSVAYSIPFIGWVMKFAGILFGFGGLMLVIKDWLTEFKKA